MCSCCALRVCVRVRCTCLGRIHTAAAASQLHHRPRRFYGLQHGRRADRFRARLEPDRFAAAATATATATAAATATGLRSARLCGQPRTGVRAAERLPATSFGRRSAGLRGRVRRDQRRRVSVLGDVVLNRVPDEHGRNTTRRSDGQLINGFFSLFHRRRAIDLAKTPKRPRREIHPPPFQLARF